MFMDRKGINHIQSPKGKQHLELLPLFSYWLHIDPKRLKEINGDFRYQLLCSAEQTSLHYTQCCHSHPKQHAMVVAQLPFTPSLHHCIEKSSSANSRLVISNSFLAHHVRRCTSCLCDRCKQKPAFSKSKEERQPHTILAHTDSAAKHFLLHLLYWSADLSSILATWAISSFAARQSCQEGNAHLNQITYKITFSAWRSVCLHKGSNKSDAQVGFHPGLIILPCPNGYLSMHRAILELKTHPFIPDTQLHLHRELTQETYHK